MVQLGNAADGQGGEYNKKWRAYVLISATSLTNFVSVGEAIDNLEYLPHTFYGRGPALNKMFGIVTFALSLLILAVDLIGFIRNKFDFKSLKDGKVEGWTLFLFLLWWACGTISMTRAGAIGYAALNIYFSTWASLFACIYALNLWGGERDILTLRQLTRLSITLGSWWVVFWSSVVVLGSAADALRLAKTEYAIGSCIQAVVAGAITTLVSAFFILSHYEFFQCSQACSVWLTYGGWFELVLSVVTNIWLVVGLEQLTGAGAIASTITGNGGMDEEDEGDYVPGSNIYVFIWTSFIASVNVTIKWKEARAMRFAQTSGDKAGEDEEEGGANDGDAETETETGNGESDEGGA